MHVSVTVLGARPDHRDGAAADVVAYLANANANRLTAAGSRNPTPPSVTNNAGPGLYYADGGASLGRWRATRDERLGPTVDPKALQRLLLGQDPITGAQLVDAQGSSGRASQRRTPLPDKETLTAEEAASVIGVDVSYIRRLAARTATYRAAHDPSTGPQPTPTGAYLDATKTDSGWHIARSEVQRFIATRHERPVVMAYDITFSAPKSLSILWAVGDPATRALCEEAFNAGVTKAVAYLEANAVNVRPRGRLEPATGIYAAAYRHDTNRELEPQLHEHVVIANVAYGPGGYVGAVDSRSLHAHATTAGYLAEAEMQHACNRRGLAWTPTHRGVANIVGVSDDAIRALSTRRAQLLNAAAETGSLSAHARQAAAYATRADKSVGVDYDDLEARWRDRLHGVGFGRKELAAATSAAPTLLWTPTDTARLDVHLAGPLGVTEHAAVFDRRDVIQTIVDYAGGRLSATEVLGHVDRWLHNDAVIPLAPQPGRNALGISHTTPEMVRLEEAITAAWRTGHDQHAAVVDSTIIRTAIENWERATGHTLGEDQTAMVHAICGSGDRYQGVVGPAGTGKTAALEVAARAWEAAGYRVIGATVNGTAAEVLARSAGIEARTVASLLTRLDTTQGFLTDRTIVIVDEASTLGNRDHAHLLRHLAASGAVLRAVGDPAQHSAVDAGGMWRAVVERWPERVPRLKVNRRQAAPEMTDVRLAGAEYRNGRIADALIRLDTNQRIITAPTAAELLDQLAADWYVDRTVGGRPSRMIAEHHYERRALNARAQALLRADGTLRSDGVPIGEATFHIGDDVIARAQNRELRPTGGDRNSYLRNGTTGTIVDITGKPGDETLVVDFTNRGIIRIPHHWLTEEIRPGVVGGLAPAYAVTSHAAQGDTYRAGRILANDTSTTEAIYVGLTRGTNDARIYTVNREPALADTDPQLPRIPDERTPVEILTDTLAKPTPAELATRADPDIASVQRALHRPLIELEASNDPIASRAAAAVRDRVTHNAINNPTPATIDHIGERDSHPQPETWDRAARHLALYRHRWNTDFTTLPPGNMTATQTDDHRLTRAAVTHAHVARLAAQPTAHLAAERRNLIAQLAGLPVPDERLRHAELKRAQQRLTDAEQRLAEARRAHQRAQSPRAQRKDPDGPERTRRDLHDAQQDVEAQRRRLVQAEARVRSITGDIAAQRDVREHIQIIDDALEPRITRATQSPASYLVDLLGPRPPTDPKQWERTALAVERYRHGTLGLEPVDGSVLELDRLGRAVGQRPDSPITASAYDHIHSATTVEQESSLHQSVPRISR